MDNKLLTSIIDFLPDATFVIDNEKKVIAWNRAMEEMTGVKREDILGKGDYAYSLPFYGENRPILIDIVMDESREAEALYDYVKSRGDTLYAETYVPSLNNGKGAYLWGTAALLLDDKGNCRGAIESIRDITERKNIEIKLRDSEERLRTIFDQTFEFMGLLTVDGTLIAANKMSLDLIGATESDVLGKPFWETPWWNHSETEQDQLKNAIQKASSGEPVRLETTHIDRNGRVRYVDFSLRPVVDGEGNIIYLNPEGHDITERKEAEEELKNREEELEIKSTNLEEVNTALKILLKERENDKVDLQEKIISNVKELIFPYIEKLKKSRLDSSHMTYVNIIDTNLNDIVSPFLQKMALKFAHLTPTEIQIANLIKGGSTTKEIGMTLNMSSGAINFHRNNIRKKLGLNKSKVNLRSYLVTL